jgi:hypothetical protein
VVADRYCAFADDYGAVSDADTNGGGTDNAPAIQRAIDTGRPVLLGPGRYRVNSTLRLNPAVGRSLGGTFGGRLGPDSPANGTWLVWGGAPGGTALSLCGIKCRVHDIGFAAARGTSLDRCVDVETPGAYPGISSQHIFENVVADGRFGAVRCGWVCGEDGKANHEFMWFRSCLTRYCTYAGVSVPNATRQAKDWVFEDTTFGGPGQYGVAWNGGSCKFYRCNFDALDCAAAWFGGSNEAVTFLDCTGESNKRFGQFTGCVNVNLLGCRLNLIAAASPQPRGQEFLAGGSNWTIAGCVFEEADGLNGFLRPGDGASVVVQATQFHSARPFPTDDATRFRLVTHGVRVAQGNDLLPEGGSYFARNVPGVTNAGGGLLLSDGRWPPRGSYAGGTYTPGPGEARLYLDSGRLWLALPGRPPQAVGVAPAAP